MGFWKGLGKVLLKAAPIAASFIPGVGPLAAMAIGAGTGALSKKLEGGSLKDSLISGGIGAASGFGAGQVAKGLGPSTSLLGKIGSGAKTMLGGGAAGTGKLGNILNIASQGMSMIPQGGGNPQGGGIGPSQVPQMAGQTAVPRAPTVRQPNLMSSITRGRQMVNPSYQPSY